MAILDDLLLELVHLSRACKFHDIPFILGGGMGLFLRETYHETRRQPRYPVAPGSRSTKDLDLFLTAELIIDAGKMDMLASILRERGYQPKTPYFQFERALSSDQPDRTVRVDLLSPPPPEGTEYLVKMHGLRIRPTGSREHIHAYLTEASESIERGTIPVRIPFGEEESEVLIPSSFNYLILKLQAFDDRYKDDAVQARHHALDIFRIVTGMTETDWDTAIDHRKADHDRPHLQEACRIREHLFHKPDAPGILMFRETEAFRAGREEY